MYVRYVLRWQYCEFKKIHSLDPGLSSIDIISLSIDHLATFSDTLIIAKALSVSVYITHYVLRLSCVFTWCRYQSAQHLRTYIFVPNRFIHANPHFDVFTCG